MEEDIVILDNVHDKLRMILESKPIQKANTKSTTTLLKPAVKLPTTLTKNTGLNCPVSTANPTAERFLTKITPNNKVKLLSDGFTIRGVNKKSKSTIVPGQSERPALARLISASPANSGNKFIPSGIVPVRSVVATSPSNFPSIGNSTQSIVPAAANQCVRVNSLLNSSSVATSQVNSVIPSNAINASMVTPLKNPVPTINVRYRSHCWIDTYTGKKIIRYRRTKPNLEKKVEVPPVNRTNKPVPIRPKTNDGSQLVDFEYKLIHDGSDYQLVHVPKNQTNCSLNNSKETNIELNNDIQINNGENVEIRPTENLGNQLEQVNPHEMDNERIKTNCTLTQPRNSTEKKFETMSDIRNYLNENSTKPAKVKNSDVPHKPPDIITLSDKEDGENEIDFSKKSVDKSCQTDIHSWLLRNGDLYICFSGNIENAMMFTKVPVKKSHFTRCHRDSCVQTDAPSAFQEVNKNDSCVQTDSPIEENNENDKRSSPNLMKRRPPRNINELPKGLLISLYHDMKTCLKEDEFGNIPLHQAVLDNDLKRLKCQCLVMKGLNLKENINHTNEDNETALMLAVKRAVQTGWLDSVEYLIRARADQTIPDNNGCYPLHYAVLHGDTKLTGILLKGHDAHSVVNKTYQGFAPIHFAAQRGFTEIAELLLDSGADINIQDRKYGRTSYYMAIENEDKEILNLLVSRGAIRSKTNFAGQFAPGMYVEGGNVNNGVVFRKHACYESSIGRLTNKFTNQTDHGSGGSTGERDSENNDSTVTESKDQSHRSGANIRKLPAILRKPKRQNVDEILSQPLYQILDNLPEENILRRALNSDNAHESDNVLTTNVDETGENGMYYLDTGEGNFVCVDGISLLQSESHKSCEDASDDLAMVKSIAKNHSSDAQTHVTTKVNDEDMTFVDIYQLKDESDFGRRKNSESLKTILTSMDIDNDEIVVLSPELSASGSNFETNSVPYEANRSQDVLKRMCDKVSIHSESTLNKEECYAYDEDSVQFLAQCDSESRTLKRNHKSMSVNDQLESVINDEESLGPQEKKRCRSSLV